VVEVDVDSLRLLFESFDPATVYIDSPATIEEVSPGQMFTLIDLVGGWKVDLVIRKDRPFSTVEFERRRPAELLGSRVMVASAEDVLLAELEWAAMSGSTRQVDDARGIVRVQGDVLDLDHLQFWADQLGVRAALDEVLAERP
jgi:hypothetical protein